jgi:hypothetical protein
MKKNEIGGECDTYGRREVRGGYWWGDLKERATSKIKMDLTEVG